MHARKWIPKLIQEVKKEAYNFQSFHNQFLEEKEEYVLALGKCAIGQVNEFLKEVKSVSSKKVPKVIVVSKENPIDADKLLVDGVSYFQGDHPNIGEKSIIAGNRIKEFLDKIPKDARLWILLSGGASALAELTIEDISLDHISKINQDLLKSGASISEVNTIRKELSLLKNGGINLLTKAKEIITLAVSDVVSKTPKEVIGSSPSIYSNIKGRDVESIVDRYDLADWLKKLLGRFTFLDLKRKKRKAFKEKKHEYSILADADMLLNICANVLKENFVNKEVIISKGISSTPVESGTEVLLEEFKKLIKKYPDGFHLISVGELNVAYEGEGKGGRNSHFVLLAGKWIFLDNKLELSEDQLENISITSLATDGTDGPTNYAGASVNYRDILNNCEDISIYINSFNSYGFLEEKCKDRIVTTGFTGINLMDLRIISFKEQLF